MKEKHLQIGNKEIFEKTLERLGVEKQLDTPIYASFYGLKVIENSLIPKDKAWLISEKGELLQVFNLT